MVFKESSYRELCSVSDRVFREAGFDDFLVAIPYLHIVRAHPVLLAKYSPLLADAKASFSSKISTINSFLKYYRDWIATSFKGSPGAGESGYSASGHIPVSLDFLFVSHYLNTSQQDQSDDFYFGDLPDRLKQEGYRVGIVYINHSGQSAEAVVEGWNVDGISRFSLGIDLPKTDLKEVLAGMAEKAMVLKSLATKRSGEKLYSGFCKAAALDARSSATRANLIFARNFGRLLGDVSPSTVLFTHEGHALERLLCAQVKRTGGKTVAAGYIHAALFASQHSVLVKMPDEFCPDQVFTTGEIALEQLQKCNYYLAGKTQILGSHKINAVSGHPDNKENVCLVLPEGLLEECRFLFNYSLRIAASFPHIQFVWRLHPIVRFDGLLTKFAEFRKLPDNIRLSTQDFETDLCLAKWAMYRGSTAVVPALAAGVRPLYISRPEEINIDPLHQLSTWKMVIRNEVDLTSIFGATKRDEPADLAEFFIANEYSRKFYHPFNLHLLDSSMSASH